MNGFVFMGFVDSKRNTENHKADLVCKRRISNPTITADFSSPKMFFKKKKIPQKKPTFVSVFPKDQSEPYAALPAAVIQCLQRSLKDTEATQDASQLTNIHASN